MEYAGGRCLLGTPAVELRGNVEGHRANILNNQYRDLGVAETAGSQGPLWVMELGGC